MPEYICVRVCVLVGVRYGVGDVYIGPKANIHFRTRRQLVMEVKKAGVNVGKDTSTVDLATLYVSEGLLPPNPRRNKDHGR